jgi:hypothetical protein
MRLWTVVALLLLAGTPGYDLETSYVPPAKPGTNGAVSVIFVPRDPDLGLDQEPAPRLKLDPLQTVLVDRQAPPPARVPPFDPQTARYLDPKAPVVFPVGLSPGATKGVHTVKGTVTYFYCSRREGWCRKGSAEISVGVDVP